MGTDLTLCFDKFFTADKLKQHSKIAFIVSSKLELDRDYSIHAYISSEYSRIINIVPVCTPKVFPDNMFLWICTSEGLRKTNIDCYANKLTYIYAEEFMKIPQKIFNSSVCWNQAIYRYISCLPLKTIITLWWH